MEESTPYQLQEKPSYSREKILSHRYTQTVKEFMVAMVVGRYTYEDEADLANTAIALTDNLVKEVREKL